MCCDEGLQVPLSSTSSIPLPMNNPNEQMGGGENASLLRCCNAVSRSHPPSLTFSPSLPPLPFLTLFWPTWDMEGVCLDVRQVFLWVDSKFLVGWGRPREFCLTSNSNVISTAFIGMINIVSSKESIPVKEKYLRTSSMDCRTVLL